ncbi:hypothetical protein RIF29_05889 [Crotalaria pallida]|uniref:Uncharacterized protein n=1 Tax=Crotalaria pallida TaxID=3830 RepID=A0AAN9PB67_CROPI
MEDESVKTKEHPSRPSKYVTILDLKQRWLTQKQLEKEEAERKEQQQRQEEEAQRKEREQQQLQKERAKEEGGERRRESMVVIRTMFTDGTHRYVKKIEYRRSLAGTDLGSNSRWIKRTSGGDGGNVDMNGKGEELKENKTMRRWKKRNLKVKEKKEKGETSSEVKKSTIESELNEEKKILKGNPNVEEEKKRKNEAIEESETKKSTIESELNEEEVKNAKGNPDLEEEAKNVDSKVEEANEKIGGLYVESGDGRRSWRISRVNEGLGNQQWRRGNVDEKKKKKEKEESDNFEGKKSSIDAKKNATNFDAKKSAIQRKILRYADENVEGKRESGELGNSDQAKKSAIENELNKGKNVDFAVGEIDEKLGGLSVKPGNGNRSWGWRFKRLDEGFGQYQSQRRGNNEYYFDVHRHGFPRHNGFRGHNDEKNKIVWVKKIGTRNGNGSVGGEIET